MMSKCSDEQRRIAARCRAQGWTQVEAAKEAEIGIRTLSTWEEDPDFIALIRRYQEELGVARASALTPLVIQASAAVSTAMNSLIAGLGDDTPALRSNLKALVDTLETLIKLEREDGASMILKKGVRVDGLNEKRTQQDPLPPLRPTWAEVPDVGLTAAAESPPEEIRKKE